MFKTVTCAELYKIDPTFHSAIQKWIADRRCPIELGDYLQEVGLDAPADCARWCADQPDSFVYPHERTQSGVYPETSYERLPVYWCPVSRVVLHANEVPREQLSGKLAREPETKENVNIALLWLLDNWIAREG